MKPAAFVGLILASCSNEASPAGKAHLFVSYDAPNYRCVLKANGEEIDVRSEGNFERVAKTWPGQRVTILAATETPYKCIGGAVFVLQRVGKDVSFLAKPPATEQ